MVFEGERASLVVDEGDADTPPWIANPTGVRKARPGELIHAEPTRQIYGTYTQSTWDAFETQDVETASLQVWQDGNLPSKLSVTVEVANSNDEAEYVASTNKALVLTSSNTTGQQSVTLGSKYARLKFEPLFAASTTQPMNIRATLFFKER